MNTPPVLVLAPLHGVTNRLFRRIFLSAFHGFDAVLAPFVVAVPGALAPGAQAPSARVPGAQAPGAKAPDAKRNTSKHWRDLEPIDDGVRTVPQIIGNDAAAFVATAKVLADFGYTEVNWNLGCPYPMVTRKKRGAGLLPHPGLVDRFLDEACAKSPVPVSVKTRLGLADAREIETLVPVFDRHPLSKVILHPRVATQMYGGDVDLDAFAAVASELKHELVYNGDIRDEATFRSLASRFPRVHEWMIGRWALRDPFLAARIKGLPVPADRVAAIATFHDELFDAYRDWLYGPRHLLDKLREVWSYLVHAFPEPERLLAVIKWARTVDEYRAIVDRAFGRKPRSLSGL